jgi:hypothetical protein
VGWVEFRRRIYVGGEGRNDWLLEETHVIVVSPRHGEYATRTPRGCLKLKIVPKPIILFSYAYFLH